MAISERLFAQPSLHTLRRSECIDSPSISRSHLEPSGIKVNCIIIAEFVFKCSFLRIRYWLDLQNTHEIPIFKDTRLFLPRHWLHDRLFWRLLCVAGFVSPSL